MSKRPALQGDSKYGRHLREVLEQHRSMPWTEQRAVDLYDQLLRGEVTSREYVDYLKACATARRLNR